MCVYVWGMILKWFFCECCVHDEEEEEGEIKRKHFSRYREIDEFKSRTRRERDARGHVEVWRGKSRVSLALFFYERARFFLPAVVAG